MIILFQLSQGAQLYNKVIPEGSVRSHKKKSTIHKICRMITIKLVCLPCYSNLCKVFDLFYWFFLNFAQKSHQTRSRVQKSPKFRRKLFFEFSNLTKISPKVLKFSQKSPLFFSFFLIFTSYYHFYFTS